MDRLSFVLIICVFNASYVDFICGTHFDSEDSCNRSMVLAISGVPQLMRFDLETEEVHGFTPTTSLLAPIAVAADQEEGLVFFTDVHFKNIYKKNFKTGTDTEVIKSLASDSIADGIAVDNISKKIFYSDYAEILNTPIYSFIRSIDYDGNNGDDILTNANNLHRPRAIALDTISRYLYYTDWGDTPYISKADYTGNNNQVLLDTGLIFPNGLAPDFPNNRLYWCDAGTDSVGVINTDGSGNTLIFQISNLDLHFFDIIRIHDMLYVSNWNGQNGVIEIDSAGNARGFITVEGNIRVNGIAEICFPTNGESQLFNSNDDTTNITTTTTTTLPSSTTSVTTTTTITRTATQTTRTTSPTATTTTQTTTTTPRVPPSDVSVTQGGSNDGTNSSGGGINQTTMVVIGMSLLALVVVILIVSATLCCMCRKKQNGPEKSGAAVKEHQNKAFEPPQYLTPKSSDPMKPGDTNGADPPYLSSEYLHVNNMQSHVESRVQSSIYEQLTIYETIKDDN